MTWRKSSYSDNQGGNCVEARVAPWRKSSRSDNQGGACVEARVAGLPQVRDSKLGDDSPILTVDEDTFTGLLAGIKSGDLDG